MNDLYKHFNAQRAINPTPTLCVSVFIDCSYELYNIIQVLNDVINDTINCLA